MCIVIHDIKSYILLVIISLKETGHYVITCKNKMLRIDVCRSKYNMYISSVKDSMRYKVSCHASDFKVVLKHLDDFVNCNGEITFF